MTTVATRLHRAPDAPALPSSRAPELQIRPDSVRKSWDRVRFEGSASSQAVAEGTPGRAADRDSQPLSGTQPGPPEPSHWAATLVRAAVEVLKGQRAAAQLVRWVDADLWSALDRRARLGAQVDGVGRPTPVRVRRVHACPVSSAVWECSVVVDDGGRMRAVALRLELLRGRWCATALRIG